MARRERERYTERTKPYRRDAGHTSSGGGGGQTGGSDQNPMRNPVVLVAVGALILAGALAVGVMMGRRPASQTAASGTPAAPATTVVEAASPPAPGTVPAAETVAAPASNKKTYTAPADQKLDPSKSYFATIETAKGNIELQLWPQLAPQTVNSFVFLARDGFFDGLNFHRVVPGFVVQGGDPAGTGNGGPGYSVPAEFNADKPVPHRMGTLAMARTSDPNSAGSQFYIVLEDGASAKNLDGQYTVFGHVVKGMDVVKQIAVGDVMTKVTVQEKDGSASVVSPDDIRQGKLPTNN
jgi:peptidylprolyl isomerase